MNALSLFNGISGLHCALDRAGIKANTVYYSEIDKYANQVTQHHYPQDVALGDVTKWQEWDLDWSSIDLVTAGFPCQAWSVAGAQQGDKDPRGMLFWTTLDIIKNVLHHNPSAKFLMENVKMKKDFEEYITHHTTEALGYVEKTLINSALVSAQNRNRYYWTNFPVTQPEDKGILLRDILEGIAIKIPENFKASVASGLIQSEQKLTGESQTLDRAIRNTKEPHEKGGTLTACGYKGMGTNGMTNVIVMGGAIRGRYNADGTTSQKLECNGLEKTNTLTTVQKDNVVIYRPCELRENSKPSKDNLHHIADATDIKGNESIKRVYSAEGKAPTLTTMGEGHREPKVLCSDVLYPDATAENKRNEAAFIEHSGMNETAMKNGKAYCVTANCGGAWAKHSATKKVRTMAAVGFTQDTDVMTSHNQIKYRKLTPLECERLQNLPDNFTSMLSNTQRYKSIGNGWTIDVIAHILRCMA